MVHAPDGLAANADMLIGELAARADHPPMIFQSVLGKAVVSKG